MKQKSIKTAAAVLFISAATASAAFAQEPVTHRVPNSNPWIGIYQKDDGQYLQFLLQRGRKESVTS